MDGELEDIAVEFMEAFEAVFHYDWTYTCIGLGLFHRSSSKGDPSENTFLEPGLSEYDESEDWHCRGQLLRTYRALCRALKQRGIQPVIQHPRNEDWLYGHYELTREWRNDTDDEAAQIE